MSKLRNSNYTSVRRVIKIPPNTDIDKDGVINRKDCQPFNPKKQGLLHDLQMKRLKAQEDKLERERVEVEKKVESQKEILERKKAVQNKKLSIQQAKMREKQAVIDEINKEKNKIKQLKEANLKAKKEIFNKSRLGKAVNVSKKSINKTRDYLNDPKTKKKINSFLKKAKKLIR